LVGKQNEEEHVLLEGNEKNEKRGTVGGKLVGDHSKIQQTRPACRGRKGGMW